MKNKLWVAFFSQTGSELAEIIKHINKIPTFICTNKNIESIDTIHPYLLERCFKRLIFMPSSPTVEEYKTALKPLNKNKNNVITLHGYLRILPETICTKYNIYNGHPGNIEDYPELKGFNPQEKAFKLKIKKSGSVIHKVTSVVDSGEIVKSKKCNINLKSLTNTYEILHKNSIDLWVEFLSNYFIIH